MDETIKITANYGFQLHRPELAARLIPPPPPTWAEVTWETTKKVALYTVMGGMGAIGLIYKPQIFVTAFVISLVVAVSARR